MLHKNELLYVSLIILRMNPTKWRHRVCWSIFELKLAYEILEFKNQFLYSITIGAC